MSDDISRRAFVGAAGTIALWLAASPADLLAASNPDQGTYKVLTPDQVAAFDAFAAQVIPSEPGSGGAREANVVRFTDNALASFASDQRPAFTSALASLGRRFASLPPAQQVAAMRALDKSNHDAFEVLRTPVLAGMFANPSYGGNANRTGWKLIGFEDRFSWKPPFGFYDTPTEAARHD
ncbi:MAG: gluconate 2-dehydrogenase subunit 3 family protein [Gemmatimonadaceae bacterium]